VQTPADPKDQRSSSTETIESTALEIQHDRGIVYVYRRDGSPLLKITGLPTPVPDLAAESSASHQLTIEIVTAAAASEREAYLGTVERFHASVSEEAAGDLTRADAEALLKQAGATVIDAERTH
jgi:hypothetical protein